MTPEQKLMQPRYKVIADYPGNLYRIGLVLTADNEREETMYSAYPHLFRKLDWWKDREPSEMPKYLRMERGDVRQVKGWRSDGFVDCFDLPGEFEYAESVPEECRKLGYEVYWAGHAAPATAEDYAAYQATLTPEK